MTTHAQLNLIESAKRTRSKALATRLLLAAEARRHQAEMIGWQALAQSFARDVEAVRAIVSERFGGRE